MSVINPSPCSTIATAPCTSSASLKTTASPQAPVSPVALSRYSTTPSEATYKQLIILEPASSECSKSNLDFPSLVPVAIVCSVSKVALSQYLDFNVAPSFQAIIISLFSAAPPIARQVVPGINEVLVTLLTSFFASHPVISPEVVCSFV